MKVLIGLVIFVSVINVAYSQSMSSPKVDTSVTTTDDFIQFILKLKSLDFDSNSLDGEVNTGTTISKNWIRKKGKFKVIKYSLGEASDSGIQGGIVVTSKGSKTLCLSGRFGFFKNGHVYCDKNTHKKLIEHEINFQPVLLGNQDTLCFYSFYALDKSENDFINLLTKGDVRSLVIEDYIKVAPLKEIFNSRFDFYDFTKVLPQFGEPGPILNSFKKLYEMKDFVTMKKLMFTQNIIFNWFAAEALLYFNMSTSFLNNETISIIKKYDGKKGFTKFRKAETLKELYTTP